MSWPLDSADLVERLARHERFWEPGFAGEGSYVAVRARTSKAALGAADGAAAQAAGAVGAAALVGGAAAGTVRAAGVATRAMTNDTSQALWQRWFDLDRRVIDTQAEMAQTFFGLDALPIAQVDFGPGILPALLGRSFQLAEDTIWFDQDASFDADALFQLQLDLDAHIGQSYRAFTELLLTQAEGRYLVALTDFGSTLDSLAALYQREELLADIAIEPNRVRRQLELVSKWWIEAVTQNMGLIRRYQSHISTWVPLANQHNWYTLLSELSAMISIESFEQLSLPSLQDEAAAFEQVLYNLDGDTNARHLPAVARVANLHAIDWSPTRRYVSPTETYKEYTSPEAIKVCRQVQEHAKLVINGIPAWQVDSLMRQISHDGLFLIVDCANPIEAEEFCTQARRWQR